MNSQREFYVYAYLRCRNSVNGPKYSPYYVGKGTNVRAFRRSGRGAKPPADRSFVVMIQEGLTEQEAFDLEKYCISTYGRMDQGTGILRNLTDGGEGASGARRSEETRKKISEARARRTGEASPFWGRKHSEGTKQKFSERQRGTKSPQRGIPLTQEHREKMSISSRKYRYELVSPSGIIYTVEDGKQFARERGLDWSHLFKVVSGKRSHHKGWTGRILEPLK
jgi:hypothetical protein